MKKAPTADEYDAITEAYLASLADFPRHVETALAEAEACLAITNAFLESLASTPKDGRQMTDDHDPFLTSEEITAMGLPDKLYALVAPNGCRKSKLYKLLCMKMQSTPQGAK